MAINNPERRRSAAGVGFFLVGPGVTPNINKDVAWRAQAGWGYSGLTAFSGEPPVKFEGLRRHTGRLMH